MSEPDEYTPPEQVEYDVHLSSESQPGLLVSWSGRSDSSAAASR